MDTHNKKIDKEHIKAKAKAAKPAKVTSLKSIFKEPRMNGRVIKRQFKFDVTYDQVERKK